ncbi:hypothetical protein D3C78_359320 [compost metagenome]
MNLVRSAWPCSFQYWRASFSAVSTASEPPELKATRRMPSGSSMSITRRDNSSARGWLTPSNSWKYSSSSSWAAMAALISGRPWPTLTFHRPATPSTRRLPLSSKTKQPSPRRMRMGSRCFISLGCSMGCQKAVSWVLTMNSPFVQRCGCVGYLCRKRPGASCLSLPGRLPDPAWLRSSAARISCRTRAKSAAACGSASRFATSAAAASCPPCRSLG